MADGLPKHLIIFDGVCNFCDTSVQVIMKNDPQKRFLFTANQSAFGQQVLKTLSLPAEEVGTIYYLEEEKLHRQSTAALKIARHLKFPLNLLYPFILIPAFLRDPIYDLIAKNRYRWFGQKEACRIPLPEEQARFLA